MTKRTIIYSRDKNVQYGVEGIVKEYLRDTFADIFYDMEVQKFSDITESVREHCEVGSGGEVLVIFDGIPAPSYGGDKILSGILKSQYEMNQNLCTHNKIPFAVYEGEIENGKGYLLRAKLDKLKPAIEERIDALLLQ